MVRQYMVAFCNRQPFLTMSFVAGRGSRQPVSSVRRSTIPRMTGAASNTIGTIVIHDSSQVLAQWPKNTVDRSPEWEMPAATAEVMQDWMMPKMSGLRCFGSFRD